MKPSLSRAERSLLRPENDTLQRLIALTREMNALAEQGDQDRNDDACGILYGVLRDSAFKLRGLAEAELESHSKKGRWP